ncbi:MAG: TonB family protein [Nitrospirae bacterium]|nr:TonB family protein [Candidatus Troglogloeales bacterium]
MSFSILLDQKDEEKCELPYELSWPIISSLFIHLIFFFGLFLFAPRLAPNHFPLQDYQVSLISPKFLDMGQKAPSEVISAASPSISVSTNPTVSPPVKNAEVNMELPKKASPPPPTKLHPLAEVVPPLQEPVVPKLDTVANIPPPLEAPSLQKEEKIASLEPSVSPSTPITSEQNGVSATISIGENGGATSPNGSGFRYPYYLRSIEHKIGVQWAPPPIAAVADKRERTIAVIGFIVKQDGHIDIQSVLVEKGSGNSFFDTAALRAVYNANPLPPLPRGILDDLRVHFSFAVSLDS